MDFGDRIKSGLPRRRSVETRISFALDPLFPVHQLVVAVHELAAADALGLALFLDQIRDQVLHALGILDVQDVKFRGRFVRRTAVDRAHAEDSLPSERLSVTSMIR